MGGTLSVILCSAVAGVSWRECVLAEGCGAVAAAMALLRMCMHSKPTATPAIRAARGIVHRASG